MTVGELLQILATRPDIPDYADLYTGWLGDSATLKVAWDEEPDGQVLGEIESGQ